MLGVNSLLDFATITNLLVNLAQVSRGSLWIITAAFLTVAHWLSHAVAEIQPAQKHAQPDPTCWMHCKNSDQTEIRDMLYSPRENGNRELWWKASITVTSPGKGCLKSEKENHLWFLGIKILFLMPICMNHVLQAAMELGIMFRNGWPHIVPPGLVAPRSAPCTKCKESFSADVCIQIT